MSTKRHVKEIGLLVLFLVISLAVISAGILIQNNQNTTRTEASSYCKCDDNDKCYPDGCSRKPKTDDNTFSESRYDNVCGDSSLDPGYRMPDGLIQHFCSEQQPSCCFDIYKYKDDRLCCFQERWTCHPSLCEGASGNGDCGKYWHLPNNGWKAYGCVKEGSDGDEIPYWGLPPGLPGGSGHQAQNPTNTPQPPTATRIPSPTERPQNTQNTPVPTQPSNNGGRPSGITHIPVSSPTPIRPTQKADPSPSNLDTQGNGNSGFQVDTAPNQHAQNQQSANTNNPNQVNIPQIEFTSPQQILKEAVTVETIAQIDRVTEKPLGIAKDTFVTVKTYDQKLESMVESWIFKIRIQIQKLLP